MGRDHFVDVYMLTRTFSADTLLAQARQVDDGFDNNVLIEMIGYVDRYSDLDLALGDVDVGALRAFFVAWSEQLRAAGPGPEMR